MALTKLEKETIVNFNEAEDTAHIYTFNSAMKQRIFLFAEQNPELCQIVRQEANGSVTCVVEKSRLSLRLINPLTDEQREKRSENMKRNRKRRRGGDAQQD